MTPDPSMMTLNARFQELECLGWAVLLLKERMNDRARLIMRRRAGDLVKDLTPTEQQIVLAMSPQRRAQTGSK